MNKKKVLAMLMAAAMVFSTAIAGSVEFVSAEGSVSGGDASVSSGNATGESTITGEGEVDYVNTTIYKVGLPTTASISLTVDPQGLGGLANGETASAEDLAAGAGKVTCATIPAVVNAGSVDAKVSVKMKLTGQATGVTAIDAVNTGTANNVLLYAVPSAVDTDDAEGYTASSKGIVLSTTDATIDFILPAAAYVFSKDAGGTVTYVKDAEQASHGTAIKFEGLVNKNADWSTYANGTNSIGMEAVFSFTHTLTGADVPDDAEGAAYAMKAYTGTTVDVTPADAAPSIASAVTYSGSGDLTIPYSLGAGESGADAVTDFVFVYGGKGYSVNGSFSSTVVGGAFTINANNIVVSDAGWLSAVEAGTYTVYVVFDNDTVNYKTITLTVAE